MPRPVRGYVYAERKGTIHLQGPYNSDRKAPRRGGHRPGPGTERLVSMHTKPSLESAWLIKVERWTQWAGECLVWTGARDWAGYGLTTISGRMYRAHRVAWEAEHGSIPDGLHIHHTCETPGCVNVAHLRAVTPKEHANIHERRPPEGSWDKAADWQRRKTHCPKGHPYSGENLAISNGRRRCKACWRERYHTRKKGGRDA